MKLLTSFFVFCALLWSNVAAQTTRTVNNAAGSQAQYATITAAITASSPGDIILVQGSGVSYGTLSLTKRVAIIGTGYFLGQNGQNTQATAGVATFDNVHFLAGSEGSIFTGFGCNNIYAGTSNIVVSRCNFGGVGLIAYTTVGNFTIKQCFFSGGDVRGGNFIFKNNIIYGGLLVSSGEIVNNIINCDNAGGDVYLFEGTVSVRNNIFGTSGYPSSSSPIPNENRFHNIFVNNWPEYQGGGNLVNVDIATLFAGFPNQGDNSIDGRYKLSANSPARGAGANGVDCGAFGGDEPYVLSGMPFIPNIYELTVPNAASSGSGLRVTIKAKANN